MDTVTYNALQESIKHWEEISASKPSEVNIRSDACALCALFLNKANEDNECGGCPIAQATGRELCRNTNWEIISDLQYMYRWPSLADQDAIMGHWKFQTNRMLNFLRALVPAT